MPQIKSKKKHSPKRNKKHPQQIDFSQMIKKNLDTIPIKKNTSETQVMAFYALEVFLKTGIKEYPLAFQDYYSIGSDPECDLYISKDESQNITSYHAFIEYDDEQNSLVLKDNDSLNGIYTAEGNKCDEIPLVDETEFFIGNIRMHFKQISPFWG